MVDTCCTNHEGSSALEREPSNGDAGSSRGLMAKEEVVGFSGSSE